MYIGLIDDDLRTGKAQFPNLEIMKLSSFHKNNRDLVELVRDYRNYLRYSKLYLRKNKEDDDLPALFLSKARNKCEYDGYAFTNGIYVPMDAAIEKSLPDITIYDKIITNKKEVGSLFSRNLNRTHIRLQTADDIPEPQPKYGYLVHDKNAFQYPLLKELVKKKALINFVETQHFNNLDDAVWFATQKNFMSKINIYYDDVITTFEARELQSVEFKNKIYYKLIPESYKNAHFTLGLDILNYYIEKIESVFRYSPYLVPQCPFVNKDLRAIFYGIWDNHSKEALTEKKIAFAMSKDGMKILTTRYSTLLNKIKSLRRYGDYGNKK